MYHKVSSQSTAFFCSHCTYCIPYYQLKSGTTVKNTSSWGPSLLLGNMVWGKKVFYSSFLCPSTVQVSCSIRPIWIILGCCVQLFITLDILLFNPITVTVHEVLTWNSKSSLAWRQRLHLFVKGQAGSPNVNIPSDTSTVVPELYINKAC